MNLAPPRHSCVNSGRFGHKVTRETQRIVYECLSVCWFCVQSLVLLIQCWCTEAVKRPQRRKENVAFKNNVVNLFNVQFEHLPSIKNALESRRMMENLDVSSLWCFLTSLCVLRLRRVESGRSDPPAEVLLAGDPDVGPHVEVRGSSWKTHLLSGLQAQQVSVLDDSCHNSSCVLTRE